MRNELKSLSVVLGSIAAMAGCASNDNQVKLGDKVYTPDADGALVMTEQEVSHLTKKGEAQFVEGQFPNVKLTEAEYHLVKENDEALFSLIGEANPDEAVSALIRRGSLQENLERIVSENNWNALYFDGPDYFVKEMSVLEEESVSGAVMSVSSDYPVYTCFDEEEKVVTVIKEE